MKKLSHVDLNNIVKNSGIVVEDINNTTFTLEISLERLAAKSDEDSIVLDENNRLEVGDSLRIGANISQQDTDKVLEKLKGNIDEVEPVDLLDIGTFRKKGDMLSFELKK